MDNNETSRKEFEKAFNFTPNDFLYFDSEYEIHGKRIGSYVGRNQITDDYGFGKEVVPFCALNSKALRLNDKWEGWQAAQQQSADEIAELKEDNERLLEHLQESKRLLKVTLDAFDNVPTKAHITEPDTPIGRVSTYVNEGKLYQAIQQALSATTSSLVEHDNEVKG